MSRHQTGWFFKVVLGWVLGVFIQPVMAGAVLFEQDFSSSVSVADYRSATPSKNQFDAINDAGGSWGISSGMLSITKTANGNALIQRSTGMEGGPAGVLKFSVDVNFTFNSSNGTRLVTGTFGPPSPNHWVAWGIDSTGAANTWKVTGSTVSFTGAQTLTFFLNDSGTPITYKAPDGSSQALAFGAWDVWVGTTRVRSSVTAGVNTGANLSGFNITVQNINGGTGVFRLDNFKAQPAPQSKLRLIVISSIVVPFR